MFIYIEPYVYVNKVEDKMMYYNTLNNDFLVVNKRDIDINYLPDNKNRSLIVNQEKFEEIKQVVDKLRGKYILDFFDERHCNNLPYITAPEINFSTGVSFHNFIESRTYHDAISQVYELSLYINSKCGNDCKYCRRIYKQFNYCTKDNTNSILNLKTIKNILNCFDKTNITNINLLGGNIFLHPQISDIIKLLNKKEYSYSIIIHYLNLEYLYPYLNEIDGKIEVLITSDTEEYVLKKLIDSNNKTINFNFILSDESEYKKSEEFGNKMDKQLTYTPFYNGENLSFFKQYIFLDESDIKNISITYKDILINELINKNHYGKLIVGSNGDVRGGINDKPIGNIYKTELSKMIKDKFVNLKSWFIKRKEADHCKHCTYNAICPPISNYEENIGRNNICNLYD